MQEQCVHFYIDKNVCSLFVCAVLHKQSANKMLRRGLEHVFFVHGSGCVLFLFHFKEETHEKIL